MELMRVLKSVVEKTKILLTSSDTPDSLHESFSIFPPGMESRPLADDPIITANVNNNMGKKVCLGSIPLDVETDVGETRIFARDVDGNVKCSIFLKKDGSIEVENNGMSIKFTDDPGMIFSGPSYNVITLDDEGGVLLQNKNGSISLALGGSVNINSGNLEILT